MAVNRVAIEAQLLRHGGLVRANPEDAQSGTPGEYETCQIEYMFAERY